VKPAGDSELPRPARNAVKLRDLIASRRDRAAAAPATGAAAGNSMRRFERIARPIPLCALRAFCAATI